MAGWRVLTDGVNGLGHPGYGTIAEVTSWILLLPGVAILLPWFGAEGSRWRSRSLGERASSFSWPLLLRRSHRRGEAARLTEAMRRLAAFPRRCQAQQVFGFAGAALLSVARRAGRGVPSDGRVGLVIALSAGLLLAFAREHSRRTRWITPATRGRSSRLAAAS